VYLVVCSVWCSRTTKRKTILLVLQRDKINLAMGKAWNLKENTREHNKEEEKEGDMEVRRAITKDISTHDQEGQSRL